MSSLLVHANTSSHDLSPSAVLEQVILPSRFRYIVIVLEAVVAVALAMTAFLIFKGGVQQRRLAVVTEEKAHLEEQRDQLKGELEKRRVDHRTASNEAAWVRRNLPMQPMILELLNSVEASVNIHLIEGDLSEGGAPQMTVRFQLVGSSEQVEKAMTQINEAFYRMGFRVLAPAIPQKTSQYTEVTFPVQYPSVEEITYHSKHG